ncbi:MAG: hypothetical protein ABI360_03335, partial [Allobranchiibius sp.]
MYYIWTILAQEPFCRTRSSRDVEGHQLCEPSTTTSVQNDVVISDEGGTDSHESQDRRSPFLQRILLHPDERLT